MTLHKDLIDATWRKSSYSANGNCVEVACLTHGRFAIRDSKYAGDVVLLVSRREMVRFLACLKA
ncbi:DUF397 domain-containing protein [Sphaerisporangium sp. TRM90804]|uniref:DUF397 domain-containing protein n=1 Tax=Sphaerisporangium sp. TRM90804 TaxID=3031113 RepID=UPI00244B868B|nr:DUF397 domain-containing protein [Sphaerisporangium sp. TRM90804]MDH2426752.1 DUF397 domain-containing protein [Sphaerisporangium sp. TRM90804]